MSRRSRRRFRRRMWQAVAAVGVFGYAWQTHPAAVIATLLAAAAGLGVWLWARQHTGTWRASRADMRPCGLYQHFFAAPAGHVYIGITNNYQARLAQHATESWWYAYADLSRSLWQVWTAADCPPGYTPRDMAKAAETAAIRTYTPIGNTDENPAYLAQEPVRAQLKAGIGWVDPVPAFTPRPRRTLTGMRWAAR